MLRYIGKPNGLKLSDGGWREKTWTARKCSPPASVRWSALLGVAGVADEVVESARRLMDDLQAGMCDQRQKSGKVSGAELAFVL